MCSRHWLRYLSLAIFTDVFSWYCFYVCSWWQWHWYFLFYVLYMCFNGVTKFISAFIIHSNFFWLTSFGCYLFSVYSLKISKIKVCLWHFGLLVFSSCTAFQSFLAMHSYWFDSMVRKFISWLIFFCNRRSNRSPSPKLNTFCTPTGSETLNPLLVSTFQSFLKLFIKYI